MENLQKQNLLVVMPKAVLMTSDGYEDFGDGAYRHTRLEKRFEMKAFGLNFVVEYYYEYTHNPEESGYDDYQCYRVCAVVPKNGLSSRFAQAVKELGGQERKNAFVVQVKESSYEIHNLEQEVKARFKGISELAYSKKRNIRI